MLQDPAALERHGYLAKTESGRQFGRGQPTVRNAPAGKGPTGLALPSILNPEVPEWHPGGHTNLVQIQGVAPRAEVHSGPVMGTGLIPPPGTVSRPGRRVTISGWVVEMLRAMAELAALISFGAEATPPDRSAGEAQRPGLEPGAVPPAGSDIPAGNDDAAAHPPVIPGAGFVI